MKKLKNSSFGKILSYVKRFKGLLFLSLLCAFVSVVLTLYVPIAIGETIDFIIDKGQVDFKAITEMLIRISIASIIAVLAQWVQGVINNKITYGVVQNIRNDAFSRLQSLPVSYSDTHPHGDIVSRIITDADQFSDGLLMGFSQLFTGILTIFGTLGFMFLIN